MKLHRILLSLVAVTGMAFAGTAAAHDAGDTVKPNFARAISNIPGKSLIRRPVSRNASKTEPAKLLAVFVVDSDDKELTSKTK